jgi:DNA-binding transcriptional LysR family regulator
MNRYDEIRAFVAVAEKGSLARAAETEKITPGMLGRRITSLERRLGVRLLYRTTRHMSLTEQGAIFLDHCRDLLSELEMAEVSTFPGLLHASGLLRVIAPAYFGRRHVAAHVGSFVEHHPKVRVSLDLTNDYIDPVRAGHDLCIRIGNVIDPNFVAVRLAGNRRIVCATPDYLARHGTPRRLEDLADHDCLAVNLTSGQHRDWLFQEGGRPVSVRVEGRFDCNDGEVLAKWVRKGLCLAWRSTWEVGDLLKSGELVSVLDDFALPHFDIYAIYPRARPLTGNVNLFINALRQAYAQPGYWSRTLA